LNSRDLPRTNVTRRQSSTELFRGLLVVLLASPAVGLQALANGSDSTLTFATELADLEPKQWMRANVSGKTVEGQLIDFNESSLTLRIDVFEDEKLPLQSVSQAWVVTGNHAEKGVLYGAVVGGFGGIALASLPPLTFGGSRTPTAGQVIVGACLGTVVGAAVGGAVGATREIWSQIWP
jgi:hypothetical protein